MQSGRKLSALAMIVTAAVFLAPDSTAQTGPRAMISGGASSAPTKRLAVDPALKFVSLFGRDATIYPIAVDHDGNSYVGGTTYVAGFITTPGVFEPTCPNGGNCAFVAKIDPSGALVYSTYLSGSSGDDVIYGIAVDSAGDAFVTGSAVSTDFPTTPGAFQPTCASYLQNGISFCAAAFVAELNPAGSGLVYSSYLGGSSGNPTSTNNNLWVGNQQYGTAIAVDSTGAAYVTGQTFDSDFPTTPGAFQTTFGGGTCGTSTLPLPCIDAFITKVAPGGESLTYSTLLGGSGADQTLGIVVNQAGNAYATGGTTSQNFPVLNAFRPACTANSASTSGECENSFVTELNESGSGLVFSTYLGSSCTDGALGLALDPAENIYIAGYTCSTDFPTLNAFQASNASTATPPNNAFVTQLAPGGGSLVYSTYLGGSGADFGIGIAVDGFGEAFVTGDAGSSDFPVVNAIQSTNQGALAAAFVTGFQAGGQGLIYSTYLGGGAGTSTGVFGIAVDSQGDAWVGGDSDASTFPAAVSRSVAVRRYGSPTSQATTNSTSPAAMAAAISLDAARVSAAPASLAFEPQLVTGTTASQPVTISNPGVAPLQFSDISASSNFSVASGGTCSTSGSVAANGSCTVNVAFAPTVGGNLTGSLTLTDNGIGSPHTVALSGTGTDFALAASPASRTINAGQSATFTLNVNPVAGFNQAVALACTGAPQQSTCRLASNSATPDGTNPASVTVTVTTTGRGMVIPDPPRTPPAPGWPEGWLVLLALLSVALTALQLGPRQRALTALASCALLALLCTACGGGGGAPTGTPAGTYTLTLTGSAGTVSRQATETLTVN
jgi:Abnormal spindle-like microcephaly-assoc'd, ASPM-SPD-2-Hydin/Beta-propeller repeat